MFSNAGTVSGYERRLVVPRIRDLALDTSMRHQDLTNDAKLPSSGSACRRCQPNMAVALTMILLTPMLRVRTTGHRTTERG